MKANHNSAERFNEFLDISAENAGIPKDVFNSMKKKIQTWKEAETKNKDNYYKRAKIYTDFALEEKTDADSHIVPGAKAGGKQIKKAEGEY